MSHQRNNPNSNQTPTAPVYNYLDYILDDDEEEEEDETYVPPSQALTSASETAAALSADAELDSALETVRIEQSEALPELEPIDGLTMEQEINRLSDSDRRVYQDLYVELRDEYRKSGKYSNFNMRLPTEQLREGATENVNGYTSEQAVRFLAMTKMEGKREKAQEVPKSRSKLTERIESGGPCDRSLWSVPNQQHRKQLRECRGVSREFGRNV